MADFQSHVPLQSRSLGLRETGLLLVGAGFALMMLDLLSLAAIAGWLALGVWAWSMIRGPRPSPELSAAIGAGAVLITFWWPDDNWWFLAVPLLWTGTALLIGSLVVLVARSIKKSPQPK